MNVAAKFSAWYRAGRPAGAGHRRGARTTPDLTLASMNDHAARPDTYSRFQIDGLTVAYRQRPVLWNVNFKAKNAGMTAIVGANGAGKSTLLKAAMGIVPCLSGKISIDGAPLAASRHKLAYIPQRASIDWEFPVTALDIACMGRYRKIGWFRPPALADRDHARQCLDLVGMGGLADRQIGQLSGGQQQRVMMARALAQDAQIFLLDEPLAGIDAASEETIIALLQDLARQGRTIIAVHHELSTVSEYFDEVLLLNGHVIAHGPVETCFIPENIAETFNSNGYGKTSGKRLRAS